VPGYLRKKYLTRTDYDRVTLRFAKNYNSITTTTTTTIIIIITFIIKLILVYENVTRKMFVTYKMSVTCKIQ
jgi:hypothetical protein